MFFELTLGGLAGLSAVLLLWQWWAGRRFPLHQRLPNAEAQPALTLLKPLKGCDEHTPNCLRSWFEQDYSGAVEILFGVADPGDPVCAVVRSLQREFPTVRSRLILCDSLTGTNAKVAKLAQLERLITTDFLVISDADVRVPRDFLSQLMFAFEAQQFGLINCFYCLANPQTNAMRWEAVAINADFWSQVLQSTTLRPMNFALGAVMATRRDLLAGIGGFAALADCLADDYQLGNRIAKAGHAIQLAPAVVQCWAPPMRWREVWQHQLRWARTIRVSQPLPYFFSILSNPTLWPLIWLVVSPGPISAAFAMVCATLRVSMAFDLQHLLTRTMPHWTTSWLVFAKDLLQFAIWLAAFTGNTVEWRGQKMRLMRDGTLRST